MLKRSLQCISPCISAVLVLAGAAMPACSSGTDASNAPARAESPLPNATHAAGLVRPAWATTDRYAGRVAGAESLALQVHLRMRNEAEAEAELARVSDPDDARYGKFLSTEEFEAKYAPTAEDVAAVRAHLEASGLRVAYVPENRAYIAAEGRAADVERAFATRLGLYAVNGETKRAPIDAPTVPAALASRVLTVLGLSSPVTMQSRRVATGGLSRDAIAPEATTGGTCSEWYGSTPDTVDPAYGAGYAPLALGPCGYRPGQLRTAYGFNTIVRRGNDGTGVNVAIIDAYMSPTLKQDAQTYAANNDPDYPLGDTQLDTMWAPGTPTTPETGWYGEQILDVESVHAMAPGAHIVFVGAQSANDLDLVAAINLVVSKKLASIISNSYGSPEGQANDFVVWHATATQAGLKGIGLYFSSGDSGDENANLGFPSADFPASLDNATAVGGTSLALGQTGAPVWELGWETGVSRLTAADADAGTPATWTPGAPGKFQFGAGGGTSMVYEQPSWQKPIVPSALANIPGTPARVVPDVGMLADPVTGFLVGQTSTRTGVYKESVIGGTSLACPLFAGTMALAEQSAKRHFGFANALLYKASKKSAFRDVAPAPGPLAVAVRAGVVATFDYGALAIHTAVGFDNVTGLGVPNGATFLKNVK